MASRMFVVHDLPIYVTFLDASCGYALRFAMNDA